MIQKLSEPVALMTPKVDEPPRPEFVMRKALLLDPWLVRRLIADRQKRGIDRYDEVWDGVYVMSAAPTNEHQDLVHDLQVVLDAIVKQNGRGRVQGGANISDREEGWENNHRCPDVVVVLKDSQAIDCGTHWLGGPDFIVEVKSPDDETEKKIPFYGRVGVRELLIIDRDTRHLRLYRHDVRKLALVAQSSEENDEWIASEVIPVAFRWKSTSDGPRTEVKRTDKKRQKWTV